MVLLTAKIISGLLGLIMLFLVVSPLKIISFYIIIKPIVQPYATLQYSLIKFVPLTSIFPIILILSSIINTIFKKSYSFLAHNIIPLYLITILSTLSIVNTLDINISVSTLFKFLSGIFLYLYTYNYISTKKEANNILYAVTASTIIPMIYGYYQYFTGTGHSWRQELSHLAGTRIDSLIGEYNSYGIFLGIGIIAILMLLFQESSRKKKILLAVILVSAIISSILALNRGSWISLSCGFLIAYFFYKRQFKLRYILITGSLIAIFFSGMILERFGALGEKTYMGSSDSFAGRVAFWEKIVPLVNKHPLIGFGVGTAPLVTEKYLKNPTPPHNDYVRLSLEAGLPVALLYCYFLAREIVYSLRLTRRKENWYINFPYMVLVIYFVIISLTQNIFANVIVSTMFFPVIAVVKKIEKISLLERT